MMVAAKGVGFPRVGKVTSIPEDRTLHSSVQVQWYHQQRAPHKPRWLRYFSPSNVSGELKIDEIVLYDFNLTKMGSLKKKSRDYLKEIV